MRDILGYVLIGLGLIAAAAVFYLPFFFILRKRCSPMRQISFVLFAGSVLVILFATVFLEMGDGITFSPPRRFLNLIPLRWLSEPWEMGQRKMTVQLVSNALMFVPFGFFLPVAVKGRRTFPKTLLGAFLFSFCIELFQYFTGRSADIDDLLLNVLGGMAGYGLFALFSRLFRGKSWWSKANGGTG